MYKYSKIIKWSKYKLVRPTNEDVDETLSALDQGLVDGVNLAPWFGYDSNNAKFILGNRKVKAIIIDGINDFNISSLIEMPNLEALSICDINKTLDLSRMPKLKILFAYWSKKLLINAESSKVSNLHLWKYKSNNNDLSNFPKFNMLDNLFLYQSNITSLEGINKFNKIKSLELNYMSKLTTIGEISLENLVSFSAEVCRKLIDHESIARCKNLEKILFTDCGNMKSLKFINDLDKLKEFRFYKTNVLDGDLEPLIRIKNVSFIDKNHYNYQYKFWKQKQ